jgi:hypothetical protein
MALLYHQFYNSQPPRFPLGPQLDLHGRSQILRKGLNFHFLHSRSSTPNKSNIIRLLPVHQIDRAFNKRLSSLSIYAVDPSSLGPGHVVYLWIR